MGPIFPVVIFILMGVGLSLLFGRLKRQNNLKANKIENQIFFWALLLIFGSSLIAHAYTFSVIDSTHSHLNQINEVTGIGFLLVFLINVRLFGLSIRGGGGPKIALIEKNDPSWVKGILLALGFLVLVYLFEAILKTSISQFPGNNLTSLGTIDLDVMGVRFFSALVMFFCSVLIKRIIRF